MYSSLSSSDVSRTVHGQIRISSLVDLLCDNHGSQWSCYMQGGKEQIKVVPGFIRPIPLSLTGRLSKSHSNLEQGVCRNESLVNFRFGWYHKILDVGSGS